MPIKNVDSNKYRVHIPIKASALNSISYTYLEKFKMKRVQVLDILKQSKPRPNKPPNVNKAKELIHSQINVKGTDEEVTKKLRDEIKYLKKNQSKNQSTFSHSRDDLTGNITIFELDDSNPSPHPRKKINKAFKDLCPFRKRERTDKLLNEMKCFLHEENKLNSDEPPFIMRQLIGYLLYRTEYHEGDKKLAEIGVMLMNNEDITSKKRFDETDALSLMHDMTLSKENTRVLKRYLDKYDLQYPNTTDLLAARKKLKPEIKVLNSFTQNPSILPGVAVDYKSLVMMTTASVFDVVNHKMGKVLPSNSKYIMHYKDGADGAGSQTIWKSKSMTGMAENMYQYSILPLRLEMCLTDGERQVLWKNPSPNSPLWCRPQELIREKEGNCLHHSIPYTDKCRDILNKDSVMVNSWRNEGITYNVQHNIKDTMKDLKFKKEISGLGGADCLLCKYKQKEWMEEEKITN